MMEETGVTEVGGGGCNVCGTVLAVGAVGGTTAQFASSLLLCCSVRGGHGCCLRAERTRAAELLAPPPSSSLLDGPVRDGPEPSCHTAAPLPLRTGHLPVFLSETPCPQW
eukprot:TRINITY_DN3641_c0_g1_i5.p3 TRINITY_DN3641_c0_g1~~TRINITY_DN3641_c0_g1_i5.p3  ORF type:complete len:110 (-),score=8.47 TRINITY_DN3641_c0_g1_i5:53-382(-)